MRFRRPAWFLYQKGHQLTSGAALFGFLGDGTQSNRIPYLSTGSQGQVTQRCLGIQPSSSANVNSTLPLQYLFNSNGVYTGMGLVTDPSTILDNSGTIPAGGNYAGS